MTAAVAAPDSRATASDDLEASQLAAALRAGIHRLFETTDHLNKINVFPVPDGDTGTNLSMTLAAVLAALEREPATHAGTLLARAADAALDGARGNSGAIFAQFLLGLADATAHHATLDAAALADAADTGARYARDALSEPKEGTMLSVQRAFADALRDALHADRGLAPKVLLRASLPRVHTALAATATTLEAMRAAHVVDAGAQGFVDWLEGLLHYLETGVLDAPARAPVHDPNAEPMADGAATTRPDAAHIDARWCTECLVHAPTPGAELDLRRLRESLTPLGASIVVGGNKTKAKVHLHTDDPERVFALAAAFGTISGQKADDMRRQASAAHHERRQRVAVVTDSAADIPEELIDALGIHVVPLRVHFGNRSYLDKVTLTPAEFYRELARNPEHPKTSQPPPGDFRRAYEFLASHYEHVVSISVSAKVSGTFSSASTAAQRIAHATDATPVVQVIDSASVSCGQGLVTIAAAECARAGGNSAEVIAAARHAAAHTRAFALLASVDTAVKGGRVPPLVRTVANALNLSIVLATQPDGRVKPGGALWGRHRLAERFARSIARRVPASARYRVLIGHGNAPAHALQLAEHLRSALPQGSVERCDLTDMGTVLGVHGGQGTLIVGMRAC